MSTLETRPARSNEAARLARLVAGFRDHLEARTPTDEEIERQLPNALLDPGIEFCCAWQGGEAVGYTQTRFWTSLWAAGTEAQLDDLFVVPAARGHGVGRSLLRYALARAADRGARRFGLNTNERNEAAQALYRSEGLSPQSHALYPGGREVFWVKSLGAAGAAIPRARPQQPVIACVSLLVRDYEEAIAFYTERLGFVLLEDTPLGAGKRWVRVAPTSGAGPSLLLARAANAEQLGRVGDQTGGRVFLFLHTDDFQRDHRTLVSRGVVFVREPREEPYGIVAVFLDLYGNRWDLVQPIG